MRMVMKLMTSSILFLLVIPGVEACLTSEQNSTLQQIAANTSTDFESLYSIFSMLCNKTVIYNITNITEFNSSGYLNATEVVQLYDNFSTNQTQELENLEARINYNFSVIYNQWITNETIKDWNSTFWGKYLDKETAFIDIIDNKISKMKDSYTLKDEFLNYTSSIWSYMQYKPTTFDIYAPYIFWIFVIALMLGMVVYKFGPQYLKKPFILRGLKGETHTFEELTTEGELKRKKERLRELKLSVIKVKGIPEKLKPMLLKKIDEGEISSLEDAAKEAEILKAEGKV